MKINSIQNIYFSGNQTQRTNSRVLKPQQQDELRNIRENIYTLKKMVAQEAAKNKNPEKKVWFDNMYMCTKGLCIKIDSLMESLRIKKEAAK